MVISILTLLSGLSISSRAAAADVSSDRPTGPFAVYRIGRAAVPPVIDGELSDKGWEGALRIERFEPLRGGRSETPPTVAVLAYDEDVLYVGFRCDEPAMGRLRTEVNRHDGPTWQDDCVEVFLDPAGDRVSYAHLAINAAGVIRDAWEQVDAPGDLAWESGATAAVARDARGWTLELAIPLERLTLRTTGKPWSFQLARTRPGARQSLTMLSSHATGYHSPQGFASLDGLHLRDTPVRPVAIDLGERLPGLNTVSITLQSSVERDQRVAIALSLDGDVVAEPSGLLPASEETTWDLPWVLAPEQGGRLTLRVSADGERVGEISTPVAATPVLGEAPRKAAIYAADTPLKFHVPVSLAAGSRQSAVARWELHSGAKVVDSGSSPVDADALQVVLRPRSSGRHELRLTLDWPEGEPVEARLPLYLVESPFDR